tara:strand:+ start:40 stop:255 length:216 start_codon:yes stop_codon:yes gene_type:complete
MAKPKNGNKSNGKKSAFGALSVKAGIDQNYNPTQADKIAGATMGDKKSKFRGGGIAYAGGGRAMLRKGGKV